MINVCMETTAHYVTQGAAYDRLFLGKPLSSKKINEYIRSGYYGQAAKRRLEQRLNPPKKKPTSVEALLQRYGL